MKSNYNRRHNGITYLLIFKSRGIVVYMSRDSERSFLVNHSVFSNLEQLLNYINEKHNLSEEQVALFTCKVHRRISKAKPKIITMYKETKDEKFN